MENIGAVLDYIYEHENSTQRKISQGTNLALGNINAILKLCIKKGLVKIERINRKNIKYILTPEGMFEKSQYAYTYLQASIKRVLTLKSNLELLLSNKDLAYDQIVFLGKKDDTKTMLMQLIEEKKLPNVIWTDLFEELKELENVQIIVWQPEALKQCWEADINCINILNYSN